MRCCDPCEAKASCCSPPNLNGMSYWFCPEVSGMPSVALQVACDYRSTFHLDHHDLTQIFQLVPSPLPLVDRHVALCLRQ